MKDIEQYISSNQREFSQDEPNAGHFDRFSDKLDTFYKKENESWFERHDLSIRIAAASLIFLVIGGLLFSGAFSNLKNIFSQKIMAADLPLEIKEVMHYYNIITDDKIDEINVLAVSEEEAVRVKEMALAELNYLEENQSELEKEFQKNPGNERVLHAIVINQQKKTELLDRIINTLQQVN